MPAFKRFNRRLMLPGRSGYSLFDSFSVDVAAGSVHGTFSDKSHSERTVVDTENKLSISGGKLVFAAGVQDVWGDPGIWYPAEARVAGKVLLTTVTLTETTTKCGVGWSVLASGVPDAMLLFEPSTSLIRFYDGTNDIGLAPFSATTYQIASTLRAIGMYHFIKGGAFTFWTFLAIAPLNNAASTRPCISNTNANFTADEPRVAKRRWLPEPLCYDSFVRVDGPLGVSDIVGPDGQSCISRTWSFPAGTAAISGNAAVISPTAGAELLADPGLEATYTGGLCTSLTKSGTPTVTQSADVHGGTKAQAFAAGIVNDKLNYNIMLTNGIWYMASLWFKRTGGGGNLLPNFYDGAANHFFPNPSGGYTKYVVTARAGGTNGILNPMWSTYNPVGDDAGIVDDVSVLPLTLASLFSSVTDAKTSDALIDVKVAALTTGTQAGVAVRLDSASAPTKGIVAYFDGAGNIKCDEFTAEATWTNLIAAVAKAFTAGDTLRISAIGTAIRLYHITAAMVATLIGTATATANVNTLHGLFSTYNANTFSGFQVFPIGTGNENAALDSL
jgi:hypothetical protein